jgi:glycogen debranching enzyme
MTMMLIRANRDLAALADDLGRKAEAEELRSYVARAEAGVDYLWDETIGAYCSRDSISGRFSGLVTSASFLSFYAGLQHEARDASTLRHFERIAKRVRYVMPSLDPNDPGFDSIRYWRGPVWAVVNCKIGTGLSEAGYAGPAQRVRSDTRSLMETAGFYESYCPVSGRGSGGGDFSWTAAMWLHWARSG